MLLLDKLASRNHVNCSSTSSASKTKLKVPSKYNNSKFCATLVYAFKNSSLPFLRILGKI